MKKHIIPAIFMAFASLASASAQTIQAIVESGGSSLTTGAAPSGFDTLDNVDLYTSATKSGMTKAYFGFKIVFPQDAVINITSAHYFFRKDGVASHDSPVNLFIAPTATSSPYCVVYNAAGVQTSVNNATVAGSTVSGKTLIIGGHRWTFGVPPNQLLLNNSYAEGVSVTGTYQVGAASPVPFDFQPGDPAWNTANTKYAYAAVGVSSVSSKEEWIGQLTPGVITPGGEGGSNYNYLDHSGMLGVPGGYTVTGWQTSTDLLFWEPLLNPVGITGNKINVLVNNNGPRRFFRIGLDGVQPISWWLPDNT